MHREGVGAPLCNEGRTAALDHRQLGHIVVGGGDAHVHVRYVRVPVVFGGGAGRHQGDVVGLCAVVYKVVHAGHRHRLRAVPLVVSMAHLIRPDTYHVGKCAMGKSQDRRRHRTLAGIAAHHPYVDPPVFRRAVQSDGEGRSAPRLCRLAGYRAGRNPRRVVVDGDDFDIHIVQTAEAGVGAGRRRQRDVVGLIAVVHKLVHAGNRNRLCLVPVGGRKRQAARTHRCLAGIAAAHPDHHVGGRHGVQPYRKRGRAPAAGGLGNPAHIAHRAGGDAGRVVVGDREAKVARRRYPASAAGGGRYRYALGRVPREIVVGRDRHRTGAGGASRRNRQRPVGAQAKVGGRGAGARRGAHRERRRLAGRVVQAGRHGGRTAVLRQRRRRQMQGRRRQGVVVLDRQRLGTDNAAAGLARGRPRHHHAAVGFIHSVGGRHDRHRADASGTTLRDGQHPVAAQAKAAARRRHRYGYTTRAGDGTQRRRYIHASAFGNLIIRQCQRHIRPAVHLVTALGGQGVMGFG